MAIPRRRMPTMDTDHGFGDDMDLPQGETGGGGGGAGAGGFTPDAPLSDDELRTIQGHMDQGVFDDPIAGSKDAPRDIFASSGPKVGGGGPAPAPQSPSPGGAPDLSSILQMLPQGVEAQGAQHVAAPMQSSSPQSASLSATPPASASGGAPAPARREAFASPVNLVAGGDSGSGLLGRGGGLFAGGRGMPGGGTTGPRPTQQMLAMLEQMLGLGDE